MTLEGSIEMVEINQNGDEQQIVASGQGIKSPVEQSPEQFMQSSEFRINVIKMTVMWCAVSFSAHMLTFMNKFLEGTIYINSYIDGFAGALASGIGANLYARLGMKRMYLLSFSIALVGGFMIYGLESGQIQLPTWYLASYIDRPLTDKTLKLRKIAMNRAVDHLVPQLMFIAKFGVNLAFLCTYTASFSNEKLFPASVRPSAIGQCQLIGRMLTVFASEVTELPKPQPIMYFLALASIAICVSLTFESEEEEDKDKSEDKL